MDIQCSSSCFQEVMIMRYIEMNMMSYKCKHKNMVYEYMNMVCSIYLDPSRFECLGFHVFSVTSPSWHWYFNFTFYLSPYLT